MKAILVLHNPKSVGKEWSTKLQIKDCRLHADTPDGEEIQLVFDNVYTQLDEFYYAQEFLYFTVINQLEDGNTLVVWSHINNSTSNVFTSCNNFLQFFLLQVGNSLERWRIDRINASGEWENIQDYGKQALDELKKQTNIACYNYSQNVSTAHRESLLVSIHFESNLTSYVLFTGQMVDKNLLSYAISRLDMATHKLDELRIFKYIILEIDQVGVETFHMLKAFRQTQIILQETTTTNIDSSVQSTNLKTLQKATYAIDSSEKENTRYQNIQQEKLFEVATHSESDRESECELPLSQLEKHQIYKKLENAWNAQKQSTTDESNPLDTEQQQLGTIVETNSAQVATMEEIKQSTSGKTLLDEKECIVDDIRERISELESLMNQQLRLRGNMMREVNHHHNSSQSSGNASIHSAYIGDDALSNIRKEIRFLRERLSRTTGNESISSSLDTSKETCSSQPSNSSLRVSQVSSNNEKEGANNLLSSLEDIRSRVNALKEPPRRHRHRRLHTRNDGELSTSSDRQSSTSCENQWVNATDFFADPKRHAYFGMQGRSSDLYFANAQSARPSDIYLRREKYFASSNLPGRSSDANLLNRSSRSNEFLEDYSRIPSYTSFVSDKLASPIGESPEQPCFRNSQNSRENVFVRNAFVTEEDTARRISFRDRRPSEPNTANIPAVSRPIAVQGPKYSPQQTTQEAGSDIRAEGELWQRKGHLVKFWRRRFVAIMPHSVFGNVLCIFEMESNQTLQPTKSKLLALKQTIVKSEPNTVVISGKPRYVFRVQTATSEIFLAAADSKSRQYWIEKLRTASRRT